ncbi:unnamed protein product [Ambrosiozyma monospora]|uniref:Unnamed protein product n=1 Tax=Ambrosiozyma monospora TaxID=43982 RepID=A0A9W7DFS3_AMBMO|nr:unnamed protein product [Ambrosiozyma monospora]
MTTPLTDPELSLFLFTFNCGKVPPLGDELTTQLDSVLSTYSSHPSNPQSNSNSSLTSASTASLEPDLSNLPELFVFGFQELSSLLDGTRPNAVNSILISISNNILDHLCRKYQLNFEVASINHNGTVGVIVISTFLSRVTKVQRSVNVNVGYYFTSTKGATGVRLTYNSNPNNNLIDTHPDTHTDTHTHHPDHNNFKETELTFVVLHLNANEGLKYMLRRNHDLLSIFRGMKFDDGYSVLKPTAHCFIMGDFNYRATGAYNIAGPLSVPEDLENDDYELYKDELSLLRKSNVAFRGFDEAKINFKPTYKFKVGTLKYNTKRKPSWCDRILYQSYQSHHLAPGEFEGQNENERESELLNGKADVLEYNSLENLRISDHIPVYLKIKVPYRAPNAIINGKGYLVDPWTGFPDNEMYVKPWKTFDHYRRVGAVTDWIFGSGLFLAKTKEGRISVVLAAVLVFLLVKIVF